MKQAGGHRDNTSVLSCSCDHRLRSCFTQAEILILPCLLARDSIPAHTKQPEAQPCHQDMKDNAELAGTLIAPSGPSNRHGLACLQF